MIVGEQSDLISGRTDWARLYAQSDDEIESIAQADEDNPATVSDDEWADAFVGLPAAEVLRLAEESKR